VNSIMVVKLDGSRVQLPGTALTFDRRIDHTVTIANDDAGMCSIILPPRPHQVSGAKRDVYAYRWGTGRGQVPWVSTLL
jgi:hypothetical protein